MDPSEIARLVAELNLEQEAADSVIEIRQSEGSGGVRSIAGRRGRLLVGKIFATKVANRDTLRAHVPRILRIRSEVDIEIVGDNLFVIVFTNERDCIHALHDGPWHFFDNFMAFKEPLVLEKPSDVKFEEFTTWIQCHNLPIMCMNPSTIRRIGEAVGRVEDIDEGEGGNCLGQYARVRITRNISQPLQRCVKVSLEGSKEAQTILIRYERLPDFCTACGRLDHVVRHCTDTTVDKTKKAFGPWLRATRTQELRRHRGMEGRKEKDNRQSSNGAGEEEILAQGRCNQRENTISGEEEVRSSAAPSMEEQRGAHTDQLIPYTIHRIRDREQIPHESITNIGDTEAEGRSIGELMVPRDGMEVGSGVHVSSGPNPPEGKTMASLRGWKRRARGTVQTTALSAEIAFVQGPLKRTRDREGAPMDEAEISMQSKQRRVSEEVQNEESAAATAWQSRRAL